MSTDQHVNKRRTSGGQDTVADSGHHRVVKFDRQGNVTLSYTGSQQFNQVQGLGLDANGALYAVDRNANDVLKLGPPTSGGFGAMSFVVGGAVTTAAPAVAVVAKDVGGVVARQDHAAVVIPPQALAQDTLITVSSDVTHSPVEATAMAAQGAAMGLKGAAPTINYGPEGTQFAVPVTIVLPFDPALVSAYGMNADALKVYYWNPTAGHWEALDSTIDPINHTVAAQTSHFSAYQVMGSGGSSVGVASAAQDAFGLRAAYVFPNPVRGVRAVTIRVQPGLADSVEVHVYDVTGRRVHSSSDFRFAVLDDGNGLGAQDTYDHVWDVSGVGSGVYTYVITAKKGGQADIHKSGKVGVIK
ncbi:MAG TPA: T9SS type A sorting domain-containing protein [Elusimicrobiota bacterium]|nr:T9SS type A sorting domain-containing protein [Elusimicrobiota bacterium]